MKYTFDNVNEYDKILLKDGRAGVIVFITPDFFEVELTTNASDKNEESSFIYTHPNDVVTVTQTYKDIDSILIRASN